MSDLNISHTVLSLSAPGTHLVPNDDPTGLIITQEANNYLSELCSSNPTEFSFFASLPLPDVAGSISEIERVSTMPGCVGFALMTNFHGIYPGDEGIRPVFEKFNDESSIVFFHPTNCHHVHDSVEGTGEVAETEIVNPVKEWPSSMLEYIFDSARCVTSLLTSGVVTSNPNITWVLPHAGGVLPLVLERIAGFGTKMMKKAGALTSEEMKKLLNERFYFDLAGFVLPDQLPALLGIVGPERLCYGTDWPYLNSEVCGELVVKLEEGLGGLVGEDMVENVLVRNSVQLLRKL